MFTLNWTNIKSALIYGLFMGLLAVINYVSKLNISPEVLAILGIVASLLKNFLTDNAGKLFGLVKVVPEITE